MSDFCPFIEPSEGTAKTLLESIDCHVYGLVEQSYGSLFAPGSNFAAILTAALTIYVAILGYQFILGRASLNMGELVPRMALIGVILALTTQWATYQTLVYDVVTEGPQELSALVAGNDVASEDLADRVDDATKNINEIAESWTKAGALPPIASTSRVSTSSIAQAANAARARAEAGTANLQRSNNPRRGNANSLSSGPTLLLLSSTILMLIWAGSLAAVKVIIALLLGLGPILLICALFQSMRGLTIGWARACLFLTFFPLLTTLTSFSALALIEPLVSDMQRDAAQGVYNLNAALGLFIAMITMVAMVILAVKIATMIVSNWGESLVQNQNMAKAEALENRMAQNHTIDSRNNNDAPQSRADILVQSMAGQAMKNSSPVPYMGHGRIDSLSHAPIKNPTSRSVVKFSNMKLKTNGPVANLKPARGTS